MEGGGVHSCVVCLPAGWSSKRRSQGMRLLCLPQPTEHAYQSQHKLLQRTASSHWRRQNPIRNKTLCESKWAVTRELNSSGYLVSGNCMYPLCVYVVRKWVEGYYCGIFELNTMVYVWVCTFFRASGKICQKPLNSGSEIFYSTSIVMHSSIIFKFPHISCPAWLVLQRSRTFLQRKLGRDGWNIWAVSSWVLQRAGGVQGHVRRSSTVQLRVGVCTNDESAVYGDNGVSYQLREEARGV